MQRSDREMYIHEYFEKKIFIPPHRINTNNAFNNRSGRIARNYRSLPFEDTASITIFRLNGLNKRPRFNICDGGTIVMKIESGAGRGVHYRGGCTRETRTKRRKGVRSAPNDETWKNSTFPLLFETGVPWWRPNTPCAPTRAAKILKRRIPAGVRDIIQRDITLRPSVKEVRCRD